MNYRVTLADEEGNEGSVVVHTVHYDWSLGEYYVKLEGVGPHSYPSWVTEDEFEGTYSFTSKGPSLFLKPGCPVEIVDVEPTEDELTHPSFDN